MKHTRWCLLPPIISVRLDSGSCVHQLSLTNWGIIFITPRNKLGPAEQQFPSCPMGWSPVDLCGSWHVWEVNTSIISLDWFKGKSTGNHGFYHQI